MTHLWIEDSKMSDAEIREACQPAEAAILAAGLSVEDAYEASLAECDDLPYDPKALEAWQEAERIALANTAEERAILSIA